MAQFSGVQTPLTHLNAQPIAESSPGPTPRNVDKAQPTSAALETKKVSQIPSNSVELFAHVTGTRMAFRDDIGYETEVPREDVKHLMSDVFGNTFKAQKRNIEAYFGLSFQEVIKQGYLKKSITEQMLHAHEQLKKLDTPSRYAAIDLKFVTGIGILDAGKMKFLPIPLKIDQSQICISLKTSVNEIFIPNNLKSSIFVYNLYKGREVTFQAYESETAHLKLRQ